MVKAVIIFLIIGLPAWLKSQEVGMEIWSARQSALLKSDISSPHFDGYLINPSLLIYPKNSIISLHSKSGFIGYGIPQVGLHYFYPVPNRSMGIMGGLQGLQVSHFKNYGLNLGYGLKLFPNIGLGIKQDFHQIIIPHEVNLWTSSTSISGHFPIGRSNLGWLLRKTYPISQTSSLPKQYSFRLGQFIPIGQNTQLYPSLTLEKPLYWKAALGIQHFLTQEIYILLGMEIHPIRYGIGAHFPLLTYLTATLSDTFHPMLGHDVALSIQYQWSKNNQ